MDNIDVKLMWGIIILISLYLLYKIYYKYLGEQSYHQKIKEL